MCLRSSIRLTDCTVGNGVEILDHCVFADSRIEDDARMGPFVHLRPGVVVRKKAKVGNFVEMKNRSGRRIESKPSELPGGHNDWERGQHRRRHDHL